MKIVDLTWRLPGPLATHLLALQGCEVVKFEDRNHRDPFLKWEWDPSFAAIYEAFQRPKDLRLIDFSDADDVAALHEEIAGADAVLMALPPRVESKLKLSPEEIADRYAHASIPFLRLGFRADSTASAHDLNTLAQSGLLRMHLLDRTDPIIAPPFLPVTGILFSHHIAITLLLEVDRVRQAGSVRQEWCWLQDAVDRVAAAYYPPETRDRRPETFLHNGRFPCYNIYRTSDGGHVATACVEPKFWERFRQLAELEELGEGDGLAQEGRADEVKRIIAERIGERTTEEWQMVFEGEDCCVDVV